MKKHEKADLPYMHMAVDGIFGVAYTFLERRYNQIV